MSRHDAGPAANEPPDAPGSPGGAEHRARGCRETAETLPARGATTSSTSVLNAVLEGSSAVVTFLAIFTAVIIGGLLIAFTSPTVLHAWSHLFSAPGTAFAQAWDVASSAYSAMFEGAIFNPHTVSAAFHGRLDRGDLQPAVGDRGQRHAAHPRRAGRRARLPGGHVQHRRHGPVHRRGHDRGLDRLRRPPSDDHPRRRRRDRRLRRGLDRRGVRREPEGAHRRPRGDRHHHAQLRDGVPAPVSCSA